MEAVEQALKTIRERDGVINAFTAVLEERARAKVKTAAGPLKGIPFAAKNLFDIKGISTLAGSKINRDLPRAPCGSARSTWTSTPTVSRRKTRTTARRAIHTIRSTSRAAPPAARRRR